MFHTTSHAKCILAGEHSVLRGYPALVLPVAKKTLRLDYEPDSELKVVTDSDPKILNQIFINILQHSLQLLNIQSDNMLGKFSLKNNIQIGAGLGFSAALCVAVTRWLIWKKWLQEEQLLSFTKHLEDFFHGKSSGVDIAGVLANHIVHFEISGIIRKVEVNWVPLLYLSNSGATKATKDHIQKVNNFIKANAELSKKIDHKMQNSVLMIEEALKKNETHGFEMIRLAINSAKDCFDEWDLITPELQNHLEQLHKLGAAATKPTGAGGGGYVLSLWNKTPPQNSQIEFIPIFL